MWRRRETRSSGKGERNGNWQYLSLTSHSLLQEQGSNCSKATALVKSVQWIHCKVSS